MILILVIFFIPSIVLGNSKVNVKFSECIDGDTAKFIMNDKEIKVRFLAIDTPETKHPTKDEESYGKEASNFTCNKLKNATNIVIEFDPKSDRKDKYDRYLAWVFIDDSLLQKELVSKGFAEVKYIYGNYKYLDELKSSQAKAKNNKVGIWENTKNSSFNLESLVKNLDFKYKFIVTVGIILIFIIYLIVDKKYRKKIINKTKNNVKRKIKKEFLKQIKKKQ